MKKIIVLAFAAFSFAACNDSSEATVEKTDSTMTNTTTNSAYNPSEGDVTYRDNTVKVMRKGQWVDADNDVTLENGVVVNRNGRVIRDGKEIELEDGQVVTRTGEFFDKTGRAIENAWDDTKEGLKEAGKEVKDATKKVGEEIKDAVNDKDKKNNN